MMRIITGRARGVRLETLQGEAVSRGAAHAVLVDRSREAADILRRNCLKTRLTEQTEVFCADAFAFLHSCRGHRRFDLVFLDPPYALGLIPEVLRLLLQCALLPAGSTLVCETAKPEDVFAGDSGLEASFEVLRQARYGAAAVTLLRLREDQH